MDHRPRQRRTTLLRLIDSKPGAVDGVAHDLPPRPVTWLERLGWATFGLVVLAIWIRVGVWLWDVIAT